MGTEEINSEEKSIPEQNEQRVRCSKCNATQVYIRLKTNERVCRHCGFIEGGKN